MPTSVTGLVPDTDPQRLLAAETATFETKQRIGAIFRPTSLEEVRQCVREANRGGWALYPVSSGKNWGYGSRVPTAENCALLDLGAMNRILDFNETLGYVTVEPGVTQRQLYAFLKDRKSRLWMDATGSSPECSLIGNAVERGFGHTPYGDHFGNVCGLEVVLADGEVLRTGFSGLPGARAAEVYKWGVGPSLDGLFSQSNLGIVTRMTIWLMPAPEYFQAYFFRLSEEETLGDVIEALRPLRMSGTLRSTVHIVNDYKTLNGIQQFPQGEPLPLSPEAMQAYRKRLGFGRWNGAGGLYGTRRQVAEARRLLRAALRGRAAKLQFLDERTLRLASHFRTPYRMLTGLDLSRSLALLRPVFGLMKGIPTDAPMASAYWRKKTEAPTDADPDRDRCGLIWYAPVAPAEGNCVEEMTEVSERTLLEHGFEPMISLTLITERSVAAVISIAYDRDVPGEDARAMACFRDLETRLTGRGFYPYRLGIQSMGLSDADPVRRNFLAAIRKALDPNGVLAPGRYISDPGCKR